MTGILSGPQKPCLAAGTLTNSNPGGKHCFGETPLDQQYNIRQGKPDFGALRPEPEAVDLVARMLRPVQPNFFLSRLGLRGAHS